MAASASAVRVQGATPHPWFSAEDVEEALNDGELVPVASVDDKLIVLAADGECVEGDCIDEEVCVGDDCDEEEVCVGDDCDEEEVCIGDDCAEACVEGDCAEACVEGDCCDEDGDCQAVKESVIMQVSDGFGKIQADNDTTEKVAVKLTQEAQKLEINDIIASANSAAEVAIKVATP